MSALLRAVGVIVLLVSASGALAATPEQLDQSRNKGLAWLFINQKGDGSWRTSSGLEVQATSAAMEAFMNFGIYHGRSFSAAESWLTNTEAFSTDSLSRQSMALYRSGANVATLTSRLTAMQYYPTASWGAYDQHSGSFPDTSLAMDAIWVTYTAYSDSDTSYSLGFIIDTQNLSDGGWPYTTYEQGTPASRLIPTVYNVITLSHYYWDWDVGSSISSGVQWLTARQKADGSFADDSSAATGSVLETALAYLAIKEAQNAGDPVALGAQSVMDKALNFIISRQQGDGSWEGTPFQTAVALQTLPATILADTDMDGIPDVVETVMGTNPLVADHSGLTGGNGQSVSGVTAPILLASAMINRFFTTTLTASGGAAPYTWSLAFGRLPDGLGLNGTTGTISGTPTVMGSFNFVYNVTDAAGSNTATTGQISVNKAPIRTKEPALAYFGSLQSAYSAQPDNGTVMVEAMDSTQTEDLTCDRNVTVTLKGGYDDTFTNQTGMTTIHGILTIVNGAMIVDNIAVEFTGDTTPVVPPPPQYSEDP